jgi:hypothetical protein
MKSEVMEFLPKARQEKIVIKQIADEVLVYDCARDKAHCLNPSAAAVWQRCDGRTTVGEIARLLGTDSQTVNENIVWLALAELHRSHLLEEPQRLPQTILGMSRREAVRRIGLGAAIALPLVASITAPMPAQAATCKHNNVPCGTNSECCSGVCNPGSPPRCLGG